MGITQDNKVVDGTHKLGEDSMSPIDLEGNPAMRRDVLEVDIERIEQVYR